MLHKHIYLLGVCALAVCFWFFDSSIHYFAYGEQKFEFIPAEFNELWMRLTIIVLLILFGLFADYHAGKLIKKETEKLDIYRAMLSANHHILNNFLQNMVVFKMEAERCEGFSQERLALYDRIIEDTRKQIDALASIENPDAESIEDSIRLY